MAIRFVQQERAFDSMYGEDKLQQTLHTVYATLNQPTVGLRHLPVFLTLAPAFARRHSQQTSRYRPLHVPNPAIMCHYWHPRRTHGHPGAPGLPGLTLTVLFPDPCYTSSAQGAQQYFRDPG
jgi:hypothetical protein